MPTSRVINKEKRTFSLSQESVAFLETERRHRRSNSLSEVLDEIIREKKRMAEQAKISAGIRSYYDSLSDEEMEEDRAWGRFAESQFPKE